MPGYSSFLQINDLFLRHSDDILCIAFCPPGYIATGGSDGKIIIWSAEAGTIRRTMQEEHCEYRNENERPIEKVRV